MNNHSIFCLLISLALAGCQQQASADWSVNKPLSGVNAKSSVENFSWKEGDVINLYSESTLGKFIGTYTATNSGQTSSFVPFAHSSAAQKAEKFYASYPYTYIDYYHGGGTIPAEYNCTDEDFRDIPQVAVTRLGAIGKPGLLDFRLSCNIVNLTLSSSVDFEVKSITLTSDINLSGTGRYRMDRDSIPYISIARGAKSVKYNYKGVTVKGSKSFTMVVPAHVKAANLTFNVESADGEIITKSFEGFESAIGKTLSYSIRNPKIYATRIYESSTYTSFVDLVWYNDRYYCAFRDGVTHVPLTTTERYGDIRILESKDCRTWTESLLLTTTGTKYDMRDPHFCIAEDGTLSCYYAYHLPNQPWVEPSKTIVSRFKQENGKLVEISRHNVDMGPKYSVYWMWNITRNGSTYYGVAYHDAGEYPIFVKSGDGINFEFVSEIPFYGNEASVNIINSSAYVLLRHQTDTRNAGMATADVPYTSWNVTEMNYGMHSPVGLEYNGKLYLCGRKYYERARDGVALFTYNLPSDTKLTLQYQLPCDTPASDNAYPGMIIHDEALRIVYYAIPRGKSVPDIYYYEIPLEILK